MLKILKKSSNMAKKELANEHLLHILKNTTPYQRMVWLKKTFEFWRGLEMKEYSQFQKAPTKIAVK